MSALLDSLLYRIPLHQVMQMEAREVDAEFLRRHRESHPEDFAQKREGEQPKREAE